MAQSLAKQIHDYMNFRASIEGVPHDLRVSDYKDALRKGAREIFGVLIDNNKIIGDTQNPDAYREWLFENEERPKNHPLFKYWENMANGIYFIKGVHDSPSKRLVCASRNGNYFGRGDCYFALVKDLPRGTYYIDDN